MAHYECDNCKNMIYKDNLCEAHYNAKKITKKTTFQYELSDKEAEIIFAALSKYVHEMPKLSAFYQPTINLMYIFENAMRRSQITKNNA